MGGGTPSPVQGLFTSFGGAEQVCLEPLWGREGVEACTSLLYSRTRKGGVSARAVVVKGGRPPDSLPRVLEPKATHHADFRQDPHG